MRRFPLFSFVLLALAAGGASADPGSDTNQPYSSYWFPQELLGWTPASDPDAAFNRSGVPLADRFTNPDTQVNANARDDEGRVTAISIMYPSTSNNPSQGAPLFDIHAFNYWQYVELLVFWGGSAGEGLILSPSADVIDAGHRNGVPVLGTVFFPPNVFGGQIQWVWDLVQKDGATFPVADKLIEVADYYGFDGWFINQETSGGDSTLANQMQEFLEYYQANKSPGERIMWYDSMIDTGAIAWQNELNEKNEMFFEESGRISDDMFLNFGWSSQNRLPDSRAKAISLGRDPYEVYAGVDVQATGYNRNVAWHILFPDDSVHTTSLGFYGTEWPYTSSTTPEDYYQRANRFWVGENRDPSNTTTDDDWKGIAHYVPAASPINSVPFVTSFNTGQGSLYAIDGEVLHVGDWNHRSRQDVLPTWRWIAESAGTPLTPRLDWSDAYCGGTCLEVSGDLSPANATHVKLFKTSLPVTGGTNLSLAYKNGTAGAASHLQVGLSFEDDPATFVFLDVDSTVSADWNTQTLGLAAHAGRTIAVLSLKFDAPGSVPGYTMKIGQIRVLEGAADVPAPATNPLVDVFQMSDARTGSVRLGWDHSANPVYTYDIYRRNPDSTRTHLGGTPSNAYFIAEVKRIEAEVTTVLEVEAVGLELGRAPVETTSVFWGFDPPNDPPCPNANGPYCGVVEVPLEFDASGTYDPDGTVVGYLWTFGDGDSSAVENPSHTYAAGGAYPVILTVTDDMGLAASDTTTALVAETAQDLDPDTAWYMLDDGSGTIAADSSGNGNDGAVVGATWTTGVLDGALAFDGINDYVLVGDYPKPESTMTVTVWAYAESRPGWASIAKNWAGGSGAFHLGLFGGDGDLEVQVAQADENTVGTREGTPFPLNEWHHVAMVADGSLVRLYRDGSEVGSVPYDGTLKTSRAALGIGVKPNGAGTGPNNVLPSYWHGMIDDVRLYERALCQNEIAALSEMEMTGTETVAPFPVSLSLAQNHPNPFGPSTRIRYALPDAQPVSIVVYDIAGRQVIDLVDGIRPAGRHTVEWRGVDGEGRAVSSGIYFYELRAGDFRDVRKMLLLR